MTSQGQALPCERRGELPASRLTSLARRELDLPGASGVVALGGDRFAVVDDDKGIYQVDGHEADRVLSRKRHKVLKDLEGICRAPEPGALLALSERTGRVVRVALDAEGNVDPEGEPEAVGRLPKIGKGRNKGWEGLDLLAAADSPDGVDRLVAVHEDHPRQVGLFRLPDLDDEVLLDLPEAMSEDAYDLSDVAVLGPGRLLLLSDESAAILEVVLEKDPWTLVPVAVHALDLSRDEKAEGLDVDPDGNLWLATDREAWLYRLEVVTPS